MAAYFISRGELETLAATGQQNAAWVVVALGTTYIGMAIDWAARNANDQALTPRRPHEPAPRLCIPDPS